jgi:hypothetical protein
VSHGERLRATEPKVREGDTEETQRQAGNKKTHGHGSTSTFYFQLLAHSWLGHHIPIE